MLTDEFGNPLSESKRNRKGIEIFNSNLSSLGVETKSIVDIHGNELKKPITMTVEEVGRERARVMVSMAFDKVKDVKQANLNLKVLNIASLNVLAHKVFNIGLGYGEENSNGIIEINEERLNDALETSIQDLKNTVNEWKGLFLAGELTAKDKG